MFFAAVTLCVRWGAVVERKKRKGRRQPSQQRVRDCFATVWRHQRNVLVLPVALFRCCFPFFFFLSFVFCLFDSILSFSFLTILMCCIHQMRCIMLHYYGARSSPASLFSFLFLFFFFWFGWLFYSVCCNGRYFWLPL